MNLLFKTEIFWINLTGKIRKSPGWQVKSTINKHNKIQNTGMLSSLRGRSLKLKRKISDSQTCLTTKFAVKPNSTRRTWPKNCSRLGSRRQDRKQSLELLRKSCQTATLTFNRQRVEHHLIRAHRGSSRPKLVKTLYPNQITTHFGKQRAAVHWESCRNLVQLWQEQKFPT